MKSTKLTIAAMLFFITTGITAQVSVNVNIGVPPVWATAAPVGVQFYYLPDIETYYDVPSRQYIYLNNGVWIHSVSLPYRYRTYNLHNGHTVYLTDYRGTKPYKFYKQHKVKYVGNKKWKDNGHDNGNRYENNKENDGNDKEKGKGKGKGHGKK